MFNDRTVTSPSSNSFSRQTVSERSFSSYRDGGSLQKKSLKRDLFAGQTGDNDDDKISSYSASTQCPVDSTTSSDQGRTGKC